MWCIRECRLDIPAILSDTEATRNYFLKGVVYTKNDSASIADAIDHAISEIELLRIEVRELHRQVDLKWQRYQAELESHL